MSQILPNEFEKENSQIAIEQSVNHDEIMIKAKAAKLIEAEKLLKYHKDTVKDIEKEVFTERLESLEKAKKEIMDQMKQEKKVIKHELLQDNDQYAESTRMQIETKGEVNNLKSELKESLKNYDSGEQLTIFDVVVDGEKYLLQSQKSVDIFINGKQK